jgi:hypothetical protein
MYVCSSYNSATNCLSVCLSACPDSVFVEQIKEWKLWEEFCCFSAAARIFFCFGGLYSEVIVVAAANNSSDLRMLHSCNFSR